MFIDYNNSARRAIAVRLPPSHGPRHARQHSSACSSLPLSCADILGEAAARLVDPAGMGKDSKVMGMMAGAASAVDTDACAVHCR